MPRTLTYLALLALLMSSGCEDATYADTVFHNANIYTVDGLNPTARAMAIKGDRIIYVGTDLGAEQLVNEETEMVDMNDQFVMPGFIEGHGHFMGMGELLQDINLFSITSWQEVDSLFAALPARPKGDWIVGRGWHQDKWDQLPDMHIEGYPNALTMDAFTTDNPVMLVHASGHSLFANSAAMAEAGVTVETPNPMGGRILRDESGQPTGVFEEKAMKLIRDQYLDWFKSQDQTTREKIQRERIQLAEAECLRKGITSFQDAGSSRTQIRRFQKLSEQDSLSIRLWVMLRQPYEEMKDSMSGLPYDDKGNLHFSCKAIKSEIDGALGAYGAWLLEPYSDKPGFYGQNTTEVTEVENIANLALAHNMQLCVHAIGDKGNRVMLDLFESKLKAKDETKRWRMEHAQHLHPSDIPRFADLGVIASMQAVHCTSDAPFVEKRLGINRSRHGAYVWRSLLDQGAIVSNGTDAPVEDVDPIPNFYASVTRTRPDNGMVFFREQAISREEAIYSMTMACAYAAFEEDLKGSLEVGKLADFVVLSNDLINCPEDEILETRVESTYIGGQLKYQRAED